MPSLILNSGFTTLVSGQIFSGCPYPVGGILIYLDRLASSGFPVFVGAVPPSGVSSGTQLTAASGGLLGSGGILDGFPLYAGDSVFVNNSRLFDGGSAPLLSGTSLGIQLFAPAGISGSRVSWDYDLSR